MAGPWTRYQGVEQRSPFIQTTPPDPRLPYQIERERAQAQQAPYDVEGARLENARRRQQIDDERRNAEFQAGRPDAARLFEQEQQLRSSFSGNPAVRRYLETLPMFAAAVRASDNPVGDLQIITAWAKTYDPTGTVRDQDVEIAQRAQSIPNMIAAFPSWFTGEGRLRPDVRRNLMQEIRTRVGAHAQQYNQMRGDTAQLAERYGFDVGAIVGDHPALQFRDEEEAMLGRVVGDVAVDTPMRNAQRRGGGSGADDEIRIGIGMWNGMPIDEWRRLHPEDAPDITTDPNAMFGSDLRRQGEPGAGELTIHGATLGLSDEASGVGNLLYNAITSPFMESRDFDPIGAYRAGNQARDMQLDRARANSGALGTAAEILGGFASGRPTLGNIGAGPGGRTMWGFTPPPTLGGRIATGARQGAATGGVAGFGYGEGLEGSALGAGGGAILGGGLGAALPSIGAAVQRGITSGRNLMGRNPDVARQAIANAMESDANMPRHVAQEMRRAQANGVPYMLADSGDNARGLLAASTRAPGPARTMARDALEQRQEGLAERVAGAVERDLGPAPNIDDVADELLTQAQTAAAPLYEAAYARPGSGAIAPRLAPLLARPSMRGALTRAYRLAAEEGRDPTSLGFMLDDAGEVVLTREPSWQTLDYVKRGMDDVVESYRDSTTGRLNLDTEGRAINNTLRTFLSIVDQANPEYAAARAAYAGPVQARTAMEQGRRALLASPDDIHRVTRDMNPSQLEFYRTGVRRAIVDAVMRRGDEADIGRAIIGTPARRTVLSRLFGGKAEFNRFVQTIQAEREGFRTFRRATQGSPTAQNLQDDAALNSNIPAAVVDMTTSGLPIATILKQALQFGASRSGDQARQQIAALLSETDPASLTKLARELAREAARRRASAQAAGRRASTYGRAAGLGVGMIGPPDLR